MNDKWVLAEIKKNELINSFKDFSINEREQFDEILNEALIISPPGSEPYGFILIDKKIDKGISVKPGNIIINVMSFLGKILDLSMSIVATSKAITTDSPTVYTLALLNMLRVLYKVTKIDLSEKNAVILIFLKKLKADQKSVPEDLLISSILNSEEYNFSKKEISKSISDLLKFHCISINDGNISLKEMILEKY